MTRRRRIAQVLSLLLIVLLAGLIGLRYSISPILNRLAGDQLREMGLDHIAFDISDITFNRVVVSGIELGEDGSLEIPELNASFLWSDLIFGKVERLVLSDVRFRVRVVNNGLSFGALDPLFLGGLPPANAEGEGDELTLRDWPIKTVEIRSAIVEVKTEFGTVTLPFSGVIRQEADFSVSLNEAKMSLIQNASHIEADVTARLFPGGVINAALNLGRSEIRLGDMAADFTRGGVLIDGNLSDLDSLSARGNLVIGNSQLPFGLTPKAEMTFDLKNRDVTLAFEADEPALGVSAHVQANVLGVLEDNPQLVISAKVKSAEIAKIGETLQMPLPLKGASNIAIDTRLTLNELLALMATPEPRALLGKLPDVTLSFAGQSLSSGEVDASGGIRGALKFHSENGRLQISSAGGIHADVAGGVLAPVAEVLKTFAENASAQVSVSIAPNIEISAGETDDQVHADIDLAWQIGVGGTHSVIGRVIAGADVQTDGAALPMIHIQDLQLSSPEILLPGGASANLSLSASGAGRGADFEGHGRLDLELENLTHSGGRIKRLKARLNVQFDVDDERLNISLADCERFSVTGIHLTALLAPISEISGCVHQPGIPAVSLRRAGEVDFDLGIRLGGDAVPLQIAGVPEIVFEPKGVEVRLAGIANAAGNFSADIVYSGGEIEVPEYNLSVSGLSSVVHHNAIDPEAPSSDVQVAIAEIHSDLEALPVLLLSLKASARQNEDESLFSIGLKDKKGLVRADVDGTFDFDAKIVEATLRVPPIPFGPKARKISDYLPAAGDWVKSLRGLVFLAGKASWDEDEGLKGDADILLRGLRAKTRIPHETELAKIEAGQLGVSVRVQKMDEKTRVSAEFLAENVSASLDDLAVEGVNGLFKLENLWPPKTAEPQIISITQILAGLPLRKGQMAIDVDGVEKIGISGIYFELAKGALTADAIEIIDGNIPSIQINVANLDLHELVNLIDTEGLKARGKLNGTLPVAFREQDIFIENAQLAAEPGGMIAYHPGGEPKKQNNEIKVFEISYTDMMLGALSNFNYDEMGVNLDGRGRGDMKVRMKLKGRNPDFFTGHPVDLEVNVKGRLMQILRTGVNNYDVPENIKQRMLGFGR